MMCRNLSEIYSLTAKIISIASECEDKDRKERLLSLADKIIFTIDMMSDEADCED